MFGPEPGQCIYFHIFDANWEVSGKMVYIHWLVCVFTARLGYTYMYSKTCVKRPLKNRQNDDLNDI